MTQQSTWTSVLCSYNMVVKRTTTKSFFESMKRNRVHLRGSFARDCSSRETPRKSLLVRDSPRRKSPRERLLARDSSQETPRERLLVRDSSRETPGERLLARDSSPAQKDAFELMKWNRANVRRCLVCNVNLCHICEIEFHEVKMSETTKLLGK